MTIPPPLLFQPDPFRLSLMPSIRDGNIPRFLFRVHTPDSYGQTSLSAVMPQAVIRNGVNATQDIFTWDRKAAANLLNIQLRWWQYEESSACSLVCWTSSLLFALQYGLHRARQDNPDGYDPSDITLLLIDTRSMPDGVFVKDLDLIDAFAKYSDPMLKENLSYLQQLRQGSRGYYFGEYLSQGYLGIDGICSQATMQDLIGSGLFELMPEFEDQASWNLWANRVIQLRDRFRGGTIGITPSHHYEVRRAILIAETCFPGRWALPTAVMLLSLKPRMNKDRVILDAFAAMYSGKLMTFTLMAAAEVVQRRKCGASLSRISRLTQDGYPRLSSLRSSWTTSKSTSWVRISTYFLIPLQCWGELLCNTQFCIPVLTKRRSLGN